MDGPLSLLGTLSWHYLDYMLLQHKPGPDWLRAVACPASCWLVALSDTVYSLSPGGPNAKRRDSGMIMFVLHVPNRTGFRWIMACWTSPAWTWRTSACTSAWRRTGTAGCSPTLSCASSVGFSVENQASYADDTLLLPASIYLRVDWKSPFHHLLHPRSHWQNIRYSFVCNFLLYKETLSLRALLRNHDAFFEPVIYKETHRNTAPTQSQSWPFPRIQTKPVKLVAVRFPLPWKPEQFSQH